MGRVETVIFNGIKFRRYPDSRGSCARNYFSPSGYDNRRGIDMLHREMWKFYKGPIPAGHHIHHVDEDTSHNEIGNFECLSPDDHAARHPNKAWAHKAGHRKHLQKIRPMAAVWHSTEEGMEWHRQHMQRLWADRIQIRAIICECCGKTRRTRAMQAVKYCSRACFAKARRKSGVDNTDFTCGICGTVFRASRFDQRLYCSGRCAKTAYWRARGNPDAGTVVVCCASCAINFTAKNSTHRKYCSWKCSGKGRRGKRKSLQPAR